MIILLMGVTGSGKTTVGRLLSESLGWRYFDADDFHSRENIEKMRAGIPLNDRDRAPWLETLQRLIKETLDRDESAILACSALKQTYRDELVIDERVKLVYLKGDHRLIQERLRTRETHYMNPGLLASQFEVLEEPVDALQIDVALSPQAIAVAIKNTLIQ